MKYRLVFSTKINDLEKQVECLLEQGYTLHGSPFAFSNELSHGIAQAMVKPYEVIGLGDGSVMISYVNRDENIQE